MTAVATIPPVLLDSGAFTDHNGIHVTFVGEDTAMVALGHHQEHAAREAFRAHDGYGDVDIVTTWAVLTDPPRHDCVAGPDNGCAGCDDTDGAPWWMQWPVDEGAPGAFPVMAVEA